MLKAVALAALALMLVTAKANAQTPGHPGAHGRWPVGCKKAMQHYRSYVAENTRAYEDGLNTCFLQQIGRAECTPNSIAPRCLGQGRSAK